MELKLVKTKLLSSLRAVKRIWSMAPISVLLLGMIALLQGLAPMIVVHATQNIVLLLTSAKAIFLQPLLLWIFGVSLVFILQPWLFLFQGMLADKISAGLETNLISHFSYCRDLALMEREAFRNRIDFVKGETRNTPISLVIVSFDVIRDLITVVSLCLYLMTLNAWLPFLILLMLLPHAAVTSRTRWKEWVHKKALAAQNRRMRYLVESSLDIYTQCERVIYHAGKLFSDRYHSIFGGYYRSKQRVRAQAALLPLISFTLTLFCIALLLWQWLSADRASSMEVAALIAVLQSIIYLQQIFEDLIRNGVVMLQFSDFFVQYEDVINRTQASQHNDDAVRLDQIETIEFRHVCFSYGDGSQALDDISFTLQVDDKLAIVGPNGAGKSTLIKLLLGFYQPTSGQVLINGHDVSSLDPTSFSSHISAVFQHFGKYALTLKENLLLGSNSTQPVISKVGVPLESPLRADFDGKELSGGQWQRIAIERALIKAGQLGVYDEPTASIDPLLEAEVINDIVSAKHRISIIVTHRMGAVGGCNKVLCLESGKLSDFGETARVYQDSTLFKRMYDKQKDLYQVIGS